VFDTRLGAEMVKVHVPWESKGWNFYGIGLLDNQGPANVLRKLGAAARAEAVVGNSEFGLDGVVIEGKRPRWGADFSFALGPLDVYGEGAFRTDLVSYRDGPESVKFSDIFGAGGIPPTWDPQTLSDPTVQASGGIKTT